MKLVRAAMIGDVVGKPGLEILASALPELIKKHNIDFITVNGENAADGFGLLEADYQRIRDCGADVVTSGNHVWEKRDFWQVLEKENRMLRPANYPANGACSASIASVPGVGFTHIEKNGLSWMVINLQGRELMNAIDCPFICFDAIFKQHSSGQIVLIDFHAESSREKESLAWYCDGRASVIVGTHTHVQTADERILPLGSAYISDIGMTGVSGSVIGMDSKICIERLRKQIFYRMEPAIADSSVAMQGIIAEIDAETGKAISIQRINSRNI